MSDIRSRIINSISDDFNVRTYSEDLAWEAAEVIADKDAEIAQLRAEVRHWRNRVPISRQTTEYDIETNTKPYLEDLMGGEE